MSPVTAILLIGPSSLKYFIQILLLLYVELHPQNVPKVIIWNRSTSSQSSSSRNPLAVASKDDADDSGSECVEDFCMISGSHSSTLDRLYAWERKLYDEVKVFPHIHLQYSMISV